MGGNPAKYLRARASKFQAFSGIQEARHPLPFRVHGGAFLVRVGWIVCKPHGACVLCRRFCLTLGPCFCFLVPSVRRVLLNWGEALARGGDSYGSGIIPDK